MAKITKANTARFASIKGTTIFGARSGGKQKYYLILSKDYSGGAVNGPYVYLSSSGDFYQLAAKGVMDYTATQMKFWGYTLKQRSDVQKKLRSAYKKLMSKK